MRIIQTYATLSENFSDFILSVEDHHTLILQSGGAEVTACRE